MSIRRRRAILVGSAIVAAVTLSIPASGAPTGSHGQLREKLAKHKVILTGLNNPRELSRTPNGDLLLAVAGRGFAGPGRCSNTPEGPSCIGQNGHVIRIGGTGAHVVVRGVLSSSGPDGTFGGGAVGASKRAGSGYYVVVSPGPNHPVPGFPTWEGGKLLRKLPNGHLHIVADIQRYERRHNPDGEQIDSNPYSVLALRHQVLVADAAGDYIATVKHGRISTWTVLPDHSTKTDPVPTVLSLGADGHVYVGQLSSEIPGKAKVREYRRDGTQVHIWRHLTTVTGVARGADGSLYISEIFGGKCGFGQIPTCFPGRVVKIGPSGHRSYRNVPFPGGIAVKGGRVYVAAFSIAPASGFAGNPAWSGQLWRIFV